MTTHDNSLGAIIILKHTFHISTFAIRAPIRFLRIVGFQGKLSLHLQCDNQVRTGIRIRLIALSKFYVARHVGLSGYSRTRNCKSRKVNLIKVK